MAGISDEAAPAVSEALKKRLRKAVFKQLDEALETLKKEKTGKLNHLKAVRVRAIQSKRNLENTKHAPSKRFKMLQQQSSRNEDGTFTLNPFERRRQRSADPSSLFDLSVEKNKTEDGEIDEIAQDSQPTKAVSVAREEKKKPTRQEIKNMSVRETRDMVAGKFAEAIRVGMKSKPDRFVDTLGIIGGRIEVALFKQYRDCRHDDYKRHVRKLIYNLKRNQKLCKEVLINRVTPERVATMRSAELATEELKKARKEMTERAMKASVLRDNTPWSKAFDTSCKSCGKQTVEQFSAEANTCSKGDTWKGSSEMAVRFRCTSCKRAWTSES